MPKSPFSTQSDFETHIALKDVDAILKAVGEMDNSLIAALQEMKSEINEGHCIVAVCKLAVTRRGP